MTASGPQNMTVHARVYDASIKVGDYLGVPVGGAAVAVQLANGTSVMRPTPASGMISLSAIPLGNYTATVSYLGSTFHGAEDAKASGTASVRFLVSGPDLAAIAGAVFLAMALVFLALRRGRAAPRA